MPLSLYISLYLCIQPLKITWEIMKKDWWKKKKSWFTEIIQFDLVWLDFYSFLLLNAFSGMTDLCYCLFIFNIHNWKHSHLKLKRGGDTRNLFKRKLFPLLQLSFLSVYFFPAPFNFSCLFRFQLEDFKKKRFYIFIHFWGSLVKKNIKRKSWNLTIHVDCIWIYPLCPFMSTFCRILSKFSLHLQTSLVNQKG